MHAWRSASRATPLPQAPGSPISTASSGPSSRSSPNRATKPTARSSPSIVIAHLRSRLVSIARSTQPRRVLEGERVAAADQIGGHALVVEPAVHRLGVAGAKVAQDHLRLRHRATTYP